MALTLALALLACAAIGLVAAQREDNHRVAAQHAALQAALAELQPVLGDAHRFGAGELGLIERRAGLRDLGFNSNVVPDHGREMQSLHDADGRIVGWFSWAPEREFIGQMERLWSLVGAAGALLACAAFVGLRAARRLRVRLTALRKLTAQDAATGLPNRRSVLQHLDETLATRSSHYVALALLDIDGLRDVNDSLGRAGGDAMIRAIAERLAASLPPGGMLGRFDDDEFAAIAAADDPRVATELAETLAAAFAAPFHLDQAWQISACIGTAQAPEDGTTGDELRRHAALALRTAKRGGRGSRRRFVAQIHAEHTERSFYLRELETAIAQQALDVHYQPIVAAEGGGIVGVEALARWNHPTRGVIAPSVFIPLAEENGLMNALGETVLRRAMITGARWPSLFVSVNLSPVQIRSAGLIDLVGALIAETGMTASRVVLEITEGVLIDDPDETQVKLKALRALGVSTALDDFGTGYSSLNYLQRFPFDRLKIDRSFVAALGTAGNTGAIIQSIVTLGHALGMMVLGEGVETNEQRVLLRLAGCDEMQGFLFAKAASAAAIDEMLAKAARGTRSMTATAS